MDRRDFLLATAGGLLASAASAKDQPKLQIIDCHTHFFDPTRPEGVPWPGKHDKSLYRPVLPLEFQRLAEPLGVIGTVVVEASPWVEDNQWLLDLAAKHPFLLGIVGRLDLADDQFEKHLRRFAKDPLYRGLRINHNELTKLREAKLLDRCQLLVDHNLALDVNGGPDMPAEVARLATEMPKLRIVINHAGNLRIDGKEPPRAWREGMQAASEHPHVFCKVSALVEQTAARPAPREVDYYRPMLDALWKSFGEDRLVFGSNWPVSERGAPLDQVIGIVREYFSSHGDRAAAKYFSENAAIAYARAKRK